MMRIDENKRIFRLDTENASYIMKVSELGVLETLYFGEKVGDDDLVYLVRKVGRGGQVNMPDAKTRSDDFSQCPSEISSYGQGEYRVPSVAISFPDGSRISDFRYVGYEVGAKKPDGGMPVCRDG